MSEPAFAVGSVNSPAPDSDQDASQTFMGYVSAGINATIRSVANKLQESVSVLDFGAIAGGDTSDGQTNYQAFQAAIVFLQNFGGGELIVPAGTYAMNVSVPIMVPSNICIRGTPGASIIAPDVTTIVNTSTRPFPLASGAVFASGDPATGQASVTANNTTCVGITFDGIDIVTDYTQGSLASGFSLNGIVIRDTLDVIIKNCRLENLPNTGIYVLGCIDFRIINNNTKGNGYGQPDPIPASRNGITSSGYSTFANRLQESYSGIISGNISNYNHDEGIQFGFTCGILIENNICIGNGDLGIEGDTSFNTTMTAAVLGHEVPSQAIILGNYIDGRTATTGVLGQGGIGFSGGNEGLCTISNNTIRYVAGKMGIAASQINAGRVVIENNTLDHVNPGALSHQIEVSVQWAHIRGNRIIRPGSFNFHNAIFIFGNIQTAIIEDNYSEGVPASFARVSADSAGFSSLIAKYNTCLGTGIDGIIFSTSQAQSLALLDVSNNRLSNVNSGASSSVRAITLKPSANTFGVSVTEMVCRNNDVSYAGVTQYPIGLINMQAGVIANADIQYNNWGAPTSSKIQSCDTNIPITALIDEHNIIDGASFQGLNIYNSFTNSSIYERGVARWMSNEFTIGTESTGAGTSYRAVAIEVEGIKTWRFDPNGHFEPYNDSVYDFGLPANRVRNILQNGISLNSGTVLVAPTTGATVSITDRTNCQICDPTESLAALAIIFPPQLGDGHMFELVITQAIATLTLTPSAGTTLVGALSTTTAYMAMKWRLVSASNKWYRVG